MKRPPKRFKQPFRQTANDGRRRRTRNEYREFVTTHTDHRIFSSDNVANACGRLDKNLVSCGMTQRIVDGLESVEIEIENAKGFLFAKRCAKFHVDDGIQSLTVIETRERIGHGRVAQFTSGKAHGEIGFLQSQKRSGKRREISQIVDLGR